MAIVYWIKRRTDEDIETSGYIGVTENLDKRLFRHMRDANKGSHPNKKLQLLLSDGEFDIQIVYDGSTEECYEFENKLRPRLNIGLNIAIGGKGGRTKVGYTLSDEFRKKRSLHMQGNTIAAGNHKPKSSDHRTKISASLKGRTISEEAREKQSLAMKGRTLTEEHRKKISDAARGKKRGPYRKKSMDL